MSDNDPREPVIEQVVFDGETSTWVEVPQVLADLDAADRAAGIVRVDTNDWALVELLAPVVYDALADGGIDATMHRESFVARAVLAAIREAAQ